jgi:hypothetical protein
MLERRVGAVAALAGGALVAGVVLWRLVTASYRADVAALCDAERRSGFTMHDDLPALDEWMRGRMTTPAGNALLSGLGDVPFADRPGRLRAAAAAVGLRACPTAASYERLVAEGACRADMQRLCSYVTFPDLPRLDDVARLDAIERWLADDVSGPCARTMADPLRLAETPAVRAAALRAASSAVGILTCDVAKVLEMPPPADGGPEGSPDP